ncbi:hypothetical protein [Streptomyces sp. NPDC047042]|uniref:hypothetical protein n=1 Tax=Streptomyces sp. NPDC047042 TaxID=3154807 RepID=UPI0033C1F24B
MARRKHSLARAAALGTVAAAVALLTSCTPNSGPVTSGGPVTSSSPSNAVRSPSPLAGPTTAGAPARTGGCRSLLVPPAVKASVTAAYRSHAQPPLTHIAPVKGTFYYGSCDGTRYAGTRFQLTPGSTYAEQVALQDDGAAMKYFVDSPGTGWRYLADGGFPADPRGCAAIPQIPAHLATLWNDCRTAP